MLRNYRWFARVVLIPVLAAALITSNGCGPIKTTTFTVPMGGWATQVKEGHRLDTDNTCTPPTPPAPQLASPDPTKPEVVAGFDHWRNTVDGCLESGNWIYRGLVRFNFSPFPSGSTIQSGYLEFDVTNSSEVPQVTNRIPNCAAQLLYVSDAWSTALPPMIPGQVQMVSQHPQGGTIGGKYTLPNAVFPIPTQLPAGVELTRIPQAHFKIDVKNHLQNWLVNNAPNNGFMFTSVDETTPSPVTANTACRTHFGGFKLTVTTIP